MAVVCSAHLILDFISLACELAHMKSLTLLRPFPQCALRDCKAAKTIDSPNDVKPLLRHTCDIIFTIHHILQSVIFLPPFPLHQLETFSIHGLVSLSPFAPTEAKDSIMASTDQLRIQNLFSVKGYVCVVTGGGTGIGLMATQALAANGEFPSHSSILGNRGRNVGNRTMLNND